MKIEDTFFNLPIVRRLEELFSGPSKSCAIHTFIKILCYCEKGRYLKNCKSMIRVLEVGGKIGKAVWDFCIDNDVLCETEYGFTAMSYMLTNRMCTAKVDNDIEDDVPFVNRIIHFKDDLGIALTKEEMEEVFDGELNTAIIAKYYLFNWMEAKKKKGCLIDGFDTYKALTTWVKKTVTSPNFDRQSYLNKISSIEKVERQRVVEQSQEDSVQDDDNYQLVEVT